MHLRHTVRCFEQGYIAIEENEFCEVALEAGEEGLGEGLGNDAMRSANANSLAQTNLLAETTCLLAEIGHKLHILSILALAVS